MSAYTFYTWFSRIGGLLIIGLFTFFFIGEGTPSFMAVKTLDGLSFIAFAAPSLIGFILAWFKPYPGGILMILGGILLACFFLWKNDIGMSFVFAFPSLMIGLTFVAAARKSLI